jgi:hypothetical protein
MGSADTTLSMKDCRAAFKKIVKATPVPREGEVGSASFQVADRRYTAIVKPSRDHRKSSQCESQSEFQS